MKTKSILVLALILTIAGVSILSISAKKPIHYKAMGTIDSYVDAWSAEVIPGHWSVKIVDDVLVYSASYGELNLDEGVEGSPFGSVDIFTHTFTTDDFDIKYHVLTFSGSIEVRKVWVKPDWTREIVTWDYDAIITITPDTFFFDWDPSGESTSPQDWDRVGTTIVMQ
ncbi:hypothetical protein KA005_18695 [bacterium]|nr:hypothetical protein [bacterium]